MSNLDAILEVAIGLVLTWLIISVATVEVQDIINKMFNRRAKFLEKAILDMFHGEKGFVDQFYDQPVIKALYKKNFLGMSIKPDYIPNEAFAEAALEMFVNLGTDTDRTAEAIASIESITQNKELNYFINRIMPDADISKSVETLKSVQSKAVAFKGGAESWFDSSMTKASYWYKDKAKAFAFVIGFVLAALFNVDSVQITEQLWREPTLRQALVAQAQVSSETTGPATVSELETYYEDLGIPVGWEAGEPKSIPMDEWPSKALGFVISGLAAMQGAPFWFDMLRKLLDIKGGSSGSSGGSSAPPASQPPAAQPPTEPEPVG